VPCAWHRHKANRWPRSRRRPPRVELPDDTSWPEVIRVHQEVHRAIVRWSGKNRLLEAYALCEQELAFVVASTRPNYTARQLAELHIRLLNQLRRGGERAASALTRDIETGRRAVHEAMHTETDKVG